VVRRRRPESVAGAALTFDCDDGAAWNRILDLLAGKAAPAALFGLGFRVEQFSDAGLRLCGT
jgi:peptidoglycan/xylan/chitin deacetylase (PgdA/CDA1 family)